MYSDTLNKFFSKRIIVALLGTIVEYYDYSLYGFSAGILAQKFFAYKTQLNGLIYIFLIYATGYLAKPLGSLFFSRIGDKFGRSISLRISLFGIIFPTFIIGCLPVFQSIGKLSIYILIFARLIQGFFIAGEYDGAAIYIIEHIDKKFIYTSSTISRSMCVVGLLFGILSVNFFNYFTIYYDWLWRIPFLLSLPLGLAVIYLRKFLEETEEFKKTKKSHIYYHNTIEIIKNQWKNIFYIILLTGGFSVTYQGSIIFMKQYLLYIFPELKPQITIFSTLLVLCFGIGMFISGFIADFLGFLKVVAISLAITFLSLLFLGIGIRYNNINLTLLSTIFLSLSVGPYNGLAHGLLCQKFSVYERCRSISIGHTVGSLILSGTANSIMFYCIKVFNTSLFPIFYISIFALIYLIIVVILKKA